MRTFYKANVPRVNAKIWEVREKMKISEHLGGLSLFHYHLLQTLILAGNPISAYRWVTHHHKKAMGYEIRLTWVLISELPIIKWYKQFVDLHEKSTKSEKASCRGK